MWEPAFSKALQTGDSSLDEWIEQTIQSKYQTRSVQIRYYLWSYECIYRFTFCVLLSLMKRRLKLDKNIEERKNKEQWVIMASIGKTVLTLALAHIRGETEEYKDVNIQSTLLLNAARFSHVHQWGLVASCLLWTKNFWLHYL